MSIDLTKKNQNEIIVPEETKNNPHWEIVRNREKSVRYIIAFKSRISDVIYIHRYVTAVEAIAWLSRDINDYGKLSYTIQKVTLSKDMALYPMFDMDISIAKLHEDATIEINIAMNRLNSGELDKQ